MIKTGKIFGFIYVLFMALEGHAVNVHAEVDRNEMRVGDTFTFTVKVSSDESMSFDEPKVPPIQGVTLINAWPSSMSSTVIKNGQFSHLVTQSYNYLMAAEKVGPLKLPSVAVSIDGKTYRTKPITLSVLDSSSPPPRAQQQRANDPFRQLEDEFAQLLNRRPRNGFRTQPINPKEAFFIQVDVDKTEVYVGEQVTVSYYLYTRGDIRDIDTLKYPGLSGFWKEDIEVANRLVYTTEVVNGIPYRKALLASYALFPLKAGRAIVDAYKAKCTVYLNDRGFGFPKPFVYTKSSKPVKIQVKAVPSEGRPEDYAGTVGRFTVNSSIDQNQVPVDQPISFKVKFKGKGNAKLIDLPGINYDQKLEVYDTKSESKFFRDGSSWKEFEVLLIPRQQGDVVIPSLTASFFDPDTNKFYTVKSNEHALKILPGKGSKSFESQSFSTTPQKDSEGPGLPPLSLSYNDKQVVSIARVYGGWATGYLIAALMLFVLSYYEFGLGTKRKTVQEVVEQKVAQVSGLIKEERNKEAAVQLTNTIYYLLGELSQEKASDLEIQQLLLKAPPSVRNELGEEFIQLMSYLEIVAFAPDEVARQALKNASMKERLKSAQKLIAKAIKQGIQVGESSDV